MLNIVKKLSDLCTTSFNFVNTGTLVQWVLCFVQWERKIQGLGPMVLVISRYFNHEENV